MAVTGLDLGGPGKMSTHDAALAALAALANVTRVGFGLKETPGGVAAQWAYRLYVKWPEDGELATQITNAQNAMNALPSQHGGVPIDKFFEYPEALLSGQPPLVTGSKMTIHSQGTETDSGYGTIGAIVEKDGKKFILTAGHVLKESFIGFHSSSNAPAVEVYVPQRQVSTCTRDVVARAHQSSIHTWQKSGMATPVAIDGGLAEIQGALSSNLIVEDAGGPVSGKLRDLITQLDGSQPPQIISVWKKGATTGLTRGVVVEFLHVKHTNSGDFAFWEPRIKPTQGQVLDMTVFVSKLAPGVGLLDKLPVLCAGRLVQVVRTGDTTHNTKLHVTGQVFGRKGDSGSGIFDDQGDLIGLLSGSPGWTQFDAMLEDRPISTSDNASITIDQEPTGAVYIKPIFEHFGLDLSSGMVPPGEPAAGVALSVPGARIGVAPPRWDDLEARLRALPAGRALLALAERHFAEVRQLVHHTRRVTVVWQRSKAAAFAQLLLGVLDGTRRTVPAAIDGVRAGAAVAAILGALAHTGSPPLQAAIAAHRSWVLDAVDGVTSVDELCERLAQVAMPAEAAA